MIPIKLPQISPNNSITNFIVPFSIHIQFVSCRIESYLPCAEDWVDQIVWQAWETWYTWENRNCFVRVSITLGNNQYSKYLKSEISDGRYKYLLVIKETGYIRRQHNDVAYGTWWKNDYLKLCFTTIRLLISMLIIYHWWKRNYHWCYGS